MLLHRYSVRLLAGDMVPFITDTDLYITDLCVQIAVQDRSTTL